MTEPVARCSFCERERRETRALIEGPGVVICDRCVEVAHDYIDGITARPHAQARGCTFCGLAEARAQYAGPRAVICDACILLCVEILVEHRGSTLPRARLIRG
ncbi:MAG TPA: ClpX C4-type zinc finger protein [Kofleriaceae bacterium]|nr:ClpX C4-type zinc finger protein [Kofleriaceae bacterium]